MLDELETMDELKALHEIACNTNSYLYQFRKKIGVIKNSVHSILKKYRTDNKILISAIEKCLDENGHLADGDVCTLIDLKIALRKVKE